AIAKPARRMPLGSAFAVQPAGAVHASGERFLPERAPGGATGAISPKRSAGVASTFTSRAACVATRTVEIARSLPEPGQPASVTRPARVKTVNFAEAETSMDFPALAGDPANLPSKPQVVTRGIQESARSVRVPNRDASSLHLAR